MWNTKISGTARLLGRPPTETQLLSIVFNSIRSRLPASWQIGTSINVPSQRRAYDGMLELRAPDGTVARVVVEAKSQLEPIDVAGVVEQLRLSSDGASLFAASPYIGARVRNLLSAAGVGYGDATGNLRLQIDRPSIFIETSGANKNPWTENRPLRSLKGQAAARVVRALCDFRPPYGIRDLAKRSDVSGGSASRVVALLEREAIVTRGRVGEVTVVQWPQLIRRWTEDYSLTASHDTQTYLEPRGLDTLLKKLQASDRRYAVTGSLAAIQLAPIAPARLATIYFSDPVDAAEHLALRPADRGANVLIVTPFDSVVFQRTIQREGVTYAAVSQVAADLLTGPGRAPQEGDELLRWMEENEDAWRTR